MSSAALTMIPCPKAAVTSPPANTTSALAPLKETPAEPRPWVVMLSKPTVTVPVPLLVMMIPSASSRKVVMTPRSVVTSPLLEIAAPVALLPLVAMPSAVRSIAPEPPFTSSPKELAPVVERVPPSKVIAPVLFRVTAGAVASLVETSPTVRSIGSEPALTTTAS